MASSGSAAKGKGGDPGEIDISSLSLEQLQTLMKQVEQVRRAAQTTSVPEALPPRPRCG